MEQELWNWTESAVEMIPFALLAGFYKEKEIRITKLSEEGFCFRTVQKIEKIPPVSAENFRFYAEFEEKALAFSFRLC